MLIAKEKESESVVEYILYMWQMEDLLRGNNLDLDQVMSRLFPEDSPAEVQQEYRAWFKEVIKEMKEDGLEKAGHLKHVLDYMIALEELHQSLINTFQDKEYIALYEKSQADIASLRSKGMSDEMKEVEVCLVGLYGILLLKMSKTPISEDTDKAIKTIGGMMSYLSEQFKKRQNGSLNLPSQMNN